MAACNARGGDHPPKPRLALSVGVVGHRPNRLPKDSEALGKLSKAIAEALEAVAKATTAAYREHWKYFDGGPDLTIVSALAEGADRMAVHAALSLKPDFALEVALPFPEDVYETDFVHTAIDRANPDAVRRANANTESSLKEFRELLGHPRKRALLVLPGQKTPGLEPTKRDVHAERAYETVGQTVLGQSDIVLVVWDGQPSAGRGGTTEMVQTAIRAGLPIIYVDARAEAPTRVIWQGLSPTSVAIGAIEEMPTKTLDELTGIVDSLLRPPESESERRHLLEYYREKPMRKKMRLGFPMLMSIAGVRCLQPTNSNAPNPNSLAFNIAETAKEIASRAEVSVIATSFGWADALAVYFAQKFRSAFVMNFAAGAAAVVAAALSILFPDLKWTFVLFEVLFIGAVIVNTRYGRKGDWQRHWLEPREIAERLRVALPLWALGSRPISFPGEEPSWTGWYVRALVRQQGLRSGSLAAADWGAAKDMLTSMLSDQCRYHKDVTLPRMKSLNERLEVVGGILFYTTLVVAAGYLVFAGYSFFAGNPLSESVDELLKHCVAVASAALPAIATALYGIRINGDFEGIAHRSGRTHVALVNLLSRIRDDKPDLNVLRSRAHAAAEAMLGDVASWRLAAESRGLAIPG